MAIIPVITSPNPILNQKTQKVKTVDDFAKEVVQNLKDTLDNAKEPEGAGLAAPQIGISKRICVVKDFLPDPENTENITSKAIVLINPKIISNSKDTNIDWEGCLSVPNTYGKVKRSTKIKVKALNETGKRVTIKAHGFLARVMQHEIDHLDGILFTSKVKGPTITGEEFERLEQ